jgi:hypothetical protein
LLFLKLANTRLKTKLKMQANTSYGVLGTVSVISFFNFDQEVELPLKLARKSQKKIEKFKPSAEGRLDRHIHLSRLKSDCA